MNMRKVIWVFMLVSLLAFTGSSPASAQGAPADVVKAFLEAWDAGDFETMYGYIHPQSQAQYPQQVFTLRYENIGQTLALSGLSFAVRDTHLQGESAAVTYDVTLESAAFGSIDDPGRTMRLMSTADGWRIAWSTMDIFDALAGDSVLRSQGLARPRGTIYDRNGLPLAWDGGTTVSVYSSQDQMAGVQECAALLWQLTRQDANTLQERFNANQSDTIFFLGEMSSETYEQNASQIASVCGVTEGWIFTSEPHRAYYGVNIVSHVTGYVGHIPQDSLNQYLADGYSEGDLVGLMAVERAYEDELAGQAKRALRIVEPGGTVLREFATISGSPPTSVTLTIDREIQRITAQALADGFNYAAPNWGAPNVSTGGAAVVLDVNTGAILALASYPMFNANIFTDASMTPDRGVVLQGYGEALRNRATGEQYSPGSTFKIVTLTAALNEGLTAPDEIFSCGLEWRGQEFGDTSQVRFDWRASLPGEFDAAGDITAVEALMTSCNPFFWEYGALLFRDRGPDVLVNYAQELGMGRTYGYQRNVLPEVPGSVEPAANPPAAINEAVGQGNVAIPPIQLAVVASTIANGGTLYKPYLVQQVGGSDGMPASYTAEPEVLNELDLQPGVLEAVQRGMCGVTTHEDLGTAYIRFYDREYVRPIEDYSVCGKTGTAETALYPNAWFVAYAPAQNPEIAVVVMVEQSLEGSQVSAPIVRRILDGYFGAFEQPFPEWWQESFVPLDTPPDGGSR